jgi:hypothetical protein
LSFRRARARCSNIIKSTTSKSLIINDLEIMIDTETLSIVANKGTTFEALTGLVLYFAAIPKFRVRSSSSKPFAF